MNQVNGTAKPITKITWKQFIERMEQAGVQADDEIDYIDISWVSPEQLRLYKDEDFGWQIGHNNISINPLQ